ncbi:MAG: hypothetical protein ACOCQ4_03570 [bacterium]
MNEQILRELRNYSQSVLNSLNIELSDVLNADFEKILENSVNRMEREGKTSTEDINEAKEAFSTFIRKMYTFRESRTGTKDLVRFQALNESKSSICPLWPIC